MTTNFEELVAGYRARLHAYCYRMRRVTTLGSAWSDVSELGEPVGEPIWLEPYPSG